MKSSRPPSHKQATALIVRAKRAVRAIMAAQKLCHEDARKARRQRKRLETENSPFHAHCIANLNQQEEAAWEDEKSLDQQLVDMGRMLFRGVIPVFSQQATDHDMAALLNCHHTTIQKIRREYSAEQATFQKLITVHKLEVRKDDVLVDFYDEDCPLFHAWMAFFQEELRGNRELRDTLNKSFDEHFPDIPKYRTRTNASGQVVQMERIRPPLKVIEPDGSVGRVVER
ncbi:MAG: hypothetical protein HQL52_19470 [Magnetococcales bacterium]|nr:hypothetical protein [Magnetococcales bacterium]